MQHSHDDGFDSDLADTDPVGLVACDVLVGTGVVLRQGDSPQVPSFGKLFQDTGGSRVALRIGNCQRPGGFVKEHVRVGLDILHRLPLGTDELAEGADADVHGLAAVGRTDLEDQHVRRLLVEMGAGLPR